MNAALVQLTQPTESGALHATSSMERSLAAHFDRTEGRTPEERKLETRYRTILADASLQPAERRRELYQILEDLQGRMAAPRQDDMEIVSPAEAPRFLDDGDVAGLRAAVDKSIANLRRRTVETLPFGNRVVRRVDLLATLEDFRSLLNWNLTREQLDGVIRARYDIYRSPGKYGYGGVLYTAYNDPVFDGSLTPDATYRFPLYRAPELAKISNGKFDRSAIHRGALARRGLEIVWLKHPAEAYLFELEGSGLVRLKDGGMFRLRYAATNGRKFTGLGAEVEKNGLLQPAEQARASGRMLYLTRPDLALAQLARNPRVIFFEGERVAPTISELDLLPRRSVAVDTDYFPRGGLGFMWLDKPEFTSQNKKPSNYSTVSRFAVNDDTGAAIRGPGRIDIYWGHDQLAQLAAGQLRQPGSLFYLLKKGTNLLAPKPAVAPAMARIAARPAPARSAARTVARVQPKVLAKGTTAAKVSAKSRTPLSIVVRHDTRKPAKPVRPFQVADARLAGRSGKSGRRGQSRLPSGPSPKASGSTRRPKRS